MFSRDARNIELIKIRFIKGICLRMGNIGAVNPMECSRPAHLSEAQLDEIKRREETLGVILVAYERVPAFKKFSSQELSKIQPWKKKPGRS